VSKKRSKTAQQPAKSLAVSVSKKNGRRALKSVAKEVAGYRPDLKVRLSLMRGVRACACVWCGMRSCWPTVTSDTGPTAACCLRPAVLQNAAVARASAVLKSLRVQAAAAKSA
jgi:hypothetical protein